MLSLLNTFHGVAKSDYEKAIDSIKSVLPEQNDTVLLASIKELDRYLSSRNPEEIIQYLESGFVLARELDHLYYMAEMLNLKGTAYYYLADYPKAVSIWEEALLYCDQFTEKEYNAEVRNRLLHSTLLMNIGVVYKRYGDYAAALDKYLASLDIRKSTGFKRGIADCYINIGNIYVENKNDEKALEYFFLAEKMYKEIDNVYGEASAMNNIGLAFQRAKDLNKAKAYFEQSLEKYKEIDQEKRISLLYINLGLLYKDFDRCDQALDYFSLALIIKNEISDKLGVAWCYQYMAECFAHTRQYSKALDYYYKAINILEDIKVAKNQLACYLGVSEIYAELGDFEQAYHYKVKYAELNESVYSTDMIKQLAEKEALYANREREKEIEVKDLKISQTEAELERSTFQKWVLIIGILLMVAIAIIFIQRFRIEARFHKRLEKQNEELRRTYDYLTKTVISKEEKEVMIKEIHHRVKNNLQIISSLINLQANSVEDRSVQRMFREVQNRIVSMSLLHEQLYKAPDLAHVNVKEYLEVLLNNLFAIYADQRSIQLNLKIGVSSFGVDTLIPMGLLINEIVTNALKYAFEGRDQGTITVDLQPLEQNDGCVLKIADDGIGMPEDQFNAYSTSLGMELIQTFVSQLDGEVEVDTSNGTSYHIVLFPVERKSALSTKKPDVPAL